MSSCLRAMLRSRPGSCLSCRRRTPLCPAATELIGLKTLKTSSSSLLMPNKQISPSIMGSPPRCMRLRHDPIFHGMRTDYAATTWQEPRALHRSCPIMFSFRVPLPWRKKTWTPWSPDTAPLCFRTGDGARGGSRSSRGEEVSGGGLSRRSLALQQCTS